MLTPQLSQNVTALLSQVVKPPHNLVISGGIIRRMWFHGIQTEHEAYWLGFLAADGSVEHAAAHKVLTVNLGLEDREHLERLQRWLGVGSIHDWPSQESSTLRVCRTALVNRLNGLGIHPRKAKTVSFPALSAPLVPHFIRGLFDGDGSVFITKKKQLRWHITGSEPMLLEVRAQIVEPCRLRPLDLEILKNGSRRLCYDGNRQVRRILDYMHQDATVWLPRKRL